MANRNLTAQELERANALLNRIRVELSDLAAGDVELLFAYRRKVSKELSYDERGKPSDRKKLKMRKWITQRGICPECGDTLPEKYAELDRKRAADGYTEGNTELVHAACHQKRQASKGYS